MSMNRRQGSWRGFLMTSLIAAAVQSRAAGDDKPVAPASDAPAATAAPKEGGVLLASTNGPSPTIQLTLDDVPLAEVVKLFTRVSGANIIAASTNLQGSVTANLQGVPWRPALESILQRQGLMLSENPPGSNVFVIEKLQEGVEPRTSETIVLNYAKVDDVARLLQSMLGDPGVAGSNSVNNMVMSFPAGNMIVIRASSLKINEARKIIESLDRPRQQVYIETKIVQLSEGASKALGIDWKSLGPNDKNAEGYNIGIKPALSFGASKGNYVANGSGMGSTPVLGTETANAKQNSYSATLTPQEFDMVLSMLQGTSGAEVISNPKIIVANEEKATITIGEQEPNVNITITQPTIQGQSPVISAVLDTKTPYFEYGTTVEVQPRVNTSSNITVRIKPELTVHVQGADKTIIDPGSGVVENTYPTIDKKSVETVFSLGDGCTAAIGGFIETTENIKENHIPVLGDIPWIGPRLFGYKNRVVNRQEVLIFVTVGLVDAQSTAANAYIPKTTQLYLNSPKSK